MDDSPRSAKRRKVNTPKVIESSPPKTTSAKRASGRLTTRSVSYTIGVVGSDVEEEPAPKRGRRPKGATNGTPAKRAAVEDIDIYDDIEGALGGAVSPRPTQRRLQTGSREDTASTGEATDELQQVTAPPKRGRGRPRKEESANRSRLQNLSKSAKNKQPVDAAIHDNIALQASTPRESGKGSRTPAASLRKSTVSRTNVRRKEQIPTQEGEIGTVRTRNGGHGATASKLQSRKRTADSTQSKVPSEDEEISVATPSKSSKRRTAIRDRKEIETDDELAKRDPQSGKKQAASTRRRMNRTDHVDNQDEERWSDAEVHANGQDDDMDVDGNSVLGSVLDPTEPSPFNKPISAQKEKLAPPLIYGNLATGRELDLLKTIVMERITGKRPSPLVGLDEEYKSVYQLVEHTITAGEGNSMLVIGARGSGKTALVNKVLSEVSKDNRGDYHIVRLNGFIHTDDKIALREIWRQLGKEMDIEEDGSGPGKNYADTLTTLLALLSHPSEQTGELTDQVAKAVIFVMDEFDLFAQHPRQTLLYNLFDIAQSRKAPIVVLGLTTRIDVINSLEKRVKSRFSHRYVHLSLAKTFTAFQEICKTCLTLQPEQLSIEERGVLEGGTKGTPVKKGERDVTQAVLAEWNANIDKYFTSPSFLTTQLAPTFYRTKSVSSVLNTFLLATATLSPSTPFQPTNLMSAPDSKLCLVPNLSTLALSLLIAAARLDIIHDSDTCNFNMAYDEYVTLASKARIQSAAGGLSSSSSTSKVWGKDVARREWEGLVELGLVMPVIAGQTGGFGMIRCDVALEEIGEVLKAEKGIDRGLERWCRSI
ncbi:origin recognition complex subunit 4 C-terminus-domain-containing protein [Pyrenochaeta sp. MPI-SDFR-AT-0127]|nr:origin recognition complex subunit 4 C-terminus-domain-containing protein [Pyrenochaeta sp. MPI-SDFR-AT-0127]